MLVHEAGGERWLLEISQSVLDSDGAFVCELMLSSAEILWKEWRSRDIEIAPSSSSSLPSLPLSSSTVFRQLREGFRFCCLYVDKEHCWKTLLGEGGCCLFIA